MQGMDYLLLRLLVVNRQRATEGTFGGPERGQDARRVREYGGLRGESATQPVNFCEGKEPCKPCVIVILHTTTKPKTWDAERNISPKRKLPLFVFLCLGQCFMPTFYSLQLLWSCEPLGIVYPTIKPKAWDVERNNAPERKLPLQEICQPFFSSFFMPTFWSTTPFFPGCGHLSILVGAVGWKEEGREKKQAYQKQEGACLYAS